MASEDVKACSQWFWENVWLAEGHLIGCLLWLATSSRSWITEMGIDVQHRHQFLCVYWSAPKWLLVVEPHKHSTDTVSYLASLSLRALNRKPKVGCTHSFVRRFGPFVTTVKSKRLHFLTLRLCHHMVQYRTLAECILVVLIEIQGRLCINCVRKSSAGQAWGGNDRGRCEERKLAWRCDWRKVYIMTHC